MSDRAKIEIPDWMTPYLPLIGNTYGNDVEELVNRKIDSPYDFVVALMQSCVESQLGLLTRLHKRGALGKLQPESEECHE